MPIVQCPRRRTSVPTKTTDSARIKRVDRTTPVYTSMVLHYAAKLRYHREWLSREQQRNELQTTPARRAFKESMKRLREYGIDYDPRRGLLDLPATTDVEMRCRIYAAKLAWRNLREVERNISGWERLLVASAEMMSRKVREDLNALIAARALHREYLLKSRFRRSRWGVLSKTVLSSIRLMHKWKGLTLVRAEDSI